MTDSPSLSALAGKTVLIVGAEKDDAKYISPFIQATARVVFSSIDRKGDYREEILRTMDKEDAKKERVRLTVNKAYQEMLVMEVLSQKPDVILFFHPRIEEHIAQYTHLRDHPFVGTAGGMTATYKDKPKDCQAFFVMSDADQEAIRHQGRSAILVGNRIQTVAEKDISSPEVLASQVAQSLIPLSQRARQQTAPQERSR